MGKASPKPPRQAPSPVLLLAELLLCFLLVVVVPFHDPARMFAWIFGPLPELPWSEFLPWQSLTEGIRNVVLALAVGCLFLKSQVTEYVRYALAVCLVLGMCVMPALSQIEIRHNVDEVPGNSDRYVSATADGGVCQVEMASAAVLRGENPYGMDYDRPPASRSRDSHVEGWQRLGYDSNPALEHLTYPPGVLYVTVPFDWLSRRTLGFFDQRFIYLLVAFALALVLASFLPPGAPRRIAVVATLCNPLLAPHLSAGRNDVLVLLPLAIFAKLLLRRRWLAAAAALGGALCMKQFALLAVPYFLVAVFVASEKKLLRTARSSWPVVAVPLLAALPFLIWDPVALIDDVFLWTQGSGYPVRWDGYGLTTMAYGLGLVTDPSGPNPYGVAGLVFVLASFVGLGIWLFRKPSAENVLLASGGLIYLVLFSARAFTSGYLAVPVLLWVTALLAKVLPRLQAEAPAAASDDPS